MKRSAKVPSLAHNAVLTYLGVFAIPAMLSLYLGELSPRAARAMEAVTPVWGWLMTLWLLSACYFCVCMIASAAFREKLLTRISGFSERDEREELVTAKAARSVFLITLGCLIAAGLLGMIRFNVFEYTRWKGDRVPPLTHIGKYDLRRGEIEKRRFVMWPSFGLPRHYDAAPDWTEREDGSTQYYYEGGSVFEPEVSRTFFALAAIQVLLFHLFARRVKA